MSQARPRTSLRWLRWALAGLLAIILAVALLVGALYLRSPVGSLDFVDGWWPGGGARRVAGGIAFSPGTAVKLDVWRVAGPDMAPRPVLIFFYGGSWVAGDRREYGFVGRAYASRGFVAVIPDYRKVPQVRFPAFIDDAAQAVRWTQRNIARYGGDPRRIVLLGHSAGAYLATMLALDPRYLARAGADQAAIRAVAGLAGPYDFYPFRWQPARDAMGSAADPRQTQPISFARPDSPPLLLLTGTADTTIAPRNTLALAARARRVGARDVTVGLYPGLGHGGIVMALSRPFAAKAPVLDDTTAFFRRYTGGR